VQIWFEKIGVGLGFGFGGFIGFID